VELASRLLRQRNNLHSEMGKLGKLSGSWPVTGDFMCSSWGQGSAVEASEAVTVEQEGKEEQDKISLYCCLSLHNLSHPSLYSLPTRSLC